MMMRSFEARNIAEAMEMARETMGDDAVLLTTDAQKGGTVVVTFGLDRDDEELFDPSEFMAPPAPANDTHTSKPQHHHVSVSEAPIIQAIADMLKFHAVPADISRGILEVAERIDLPPTNTVTNLQSALVDVFHSSFRFDPLPFQNDDTRVILVGPPGMGKTITAAKLAAKMVVDNQPVRVISTDTKRAGGIDQLQAFTKILGAPLDTADSRSELKELLASYDKKDRVIIDSAGCNPYDFQELKELGELAHMNEIEPILVCSAGTDGHEATEIASVFSFLDIERVIVTRTDCARHYGSLLSIAKAGDYAFSHATSSARAMGDFQAMDAFMLAQLFTQYQRERIAA